MKLKKCIIIQLIIVIFINLITPTVSQAVEIFGIDVDPLGFIITPLAGFLATMGDVANDLLTATLTDNSETSFFPPLSDRAYIKYKITEAAERLNTDGEGLKEIEFDSKDFYSIGSYGIPNIKVTPAEIFANKISMLDANYFKTAAEYDEEQGGQEKSIALALKDTISSWYNTLRMVAIVGLLSVLVYIAIRIIISSAAEDKAKYKVIFVDWITALCLIFCLHYIMVFTMETVDLLVGIINNGTGTENYKTTKMAHVKVLNDDGSSVEFNTNLTGLMRLSVEYKHFGTKAGATLMYMALTMYTVYFAWVYMKRFLTLTFLTLIAPLVSLTYPIDKIKDSKAQAFNYWVKEYIVNAALPIVHSLLYVILVSSATDLVIEVPLYGICAVAFIVPAEKLVKSMFGIKSELAQPLGGFAGGAAASTIMNKLGGKEKESGDSKDGDTKQSKIRTKKAEGIDSSFEDMIPGGATSTLGTTSIPTGSGSAGSSSTGSSSTGTSPNRQNNQQNLNTETQSYGEKLEQMAGEQPIFRDEDRKTTNLNGEKELFNEKLEQMSKEQPIFMDESRGTKRKLTEKDKQKQRLEQMANEKPIFRDESRGQKRKLTEKDKSKQRLEQMANEKSIFRDESRNQGNKIANANRAKTHKSIKNSVSTNKNSILGNAGTMLRRKMKLTKGKSIRQLAGRGAIFTTKLASRAALMGIGLAAGMVGGDMNDMWKGLAGGFVAGGMLGDKLGNKVTGLPNKVGDFFTELKDGEDKVAEKRASRDFKNDEDNIAYMNKHYKGTPKWRKDEIMEKMNMMKISGASDDIEELDRLVKMQEKAVEDTGITKDNKDEYAKVQEQEMKRAIFKGKFSQDIEAKDFYSGDVSKVIKQQAKRFEEHGLSKDEALKAAQNLLNDVAIIKGIN